MLSKRLVPLLCLLVAALWGAELTGNYSGTFTGNTGSGTLRLQLKPDSADVSFMFDGREIKCMVTHVKMEGPKVEITYRFEVRDLKLQSKLKGELKEKTLEGTYTTMTVGTDNEVDNGTWKATSE